tara:strand:+ start:340 stop:1857 length:1518 start_codon:yes stop_codon:yes gene_type:complete
MMWRRGDEEETRALTHHHHHGGDIESTKKRTTTTTTRSSSSSVFGGKLAVVAATACATFALAPLCYLQGARSTINNGAATNASSSSSSSVLTEQKRTRSNDLDERGMLLGARSFDEGRSTGVEYDREKRINLSTEKKASTATFAKKFVEAYEHEKVEQRRRSGEDTSSSSSSSSSNKNNNLISALGSSKSKVPIYVIALEDRPEEFEKYEAIRAVFPTAEPTHGVDPLQWPNRIEDAQYAVKGLRSYMQSHKSDPALVDFLKVRQEPFVPSGLSYGKDDGISPGINWIDTFDNFREHPWLMAIDHRGSDGKLTEEEVGRAHHIGCLFAHLYQWQLMLDRGVKKALIFESDAPRIMEAIPFWASEQVADHAPVDTDILLIRSQRVGEKPPGPLVSTFLATNPHDSSEKQTINIHKYKSAGAGAGFEAYVVSSNFAKKAQAYLSRHGADMIDGYIIKLCQSSYKHAIYERAYYSMYHEDMFLEPYDAQHPKPTVFNCYVASMPDKAD